jgi:branched-chain amino acid transport system substrate-binding protein
MKQDEDFRPASSKKRSGLSRRKFIAAAAAGAAAPMLAGGRLWAADAENVLRVGFVSPRTGALGTFGEGDPHLLDISRKALASGLSVGGKTYKVTIIDRDSQSDPARAGQLAKSLINDEKIDFMLVTSTPEVVNPVADACEGAGMPCLSTVMPWEAWYFGRGGKPGQPSPFKWTYHFSFGGAQFAGMYISTWNQIPTNKKVGVMYPNDADGNAIRGFLPDAFKAAGFTVVDPGPFEDMTTDYSAQVALFKKEKCEIINALVLPPDFATFWRQAAQQGFAKSVKIIQPAKAGSAPSEIEALGEVGYNVAGGGPWNRAFPYKSPLTGFTGEDLAKSYEAATGKQAAQELGGSMAIFDAGFEALKATSDPTDKAALAKTLSNLKVTTSVGLIDFNTGPMPHVVATSPIIGMQWVKAKPGSKFKLDQHIIENAGDPNVPITGKLTPYGA